MQTKLIKLADALDRMEPGERRYRHQRPALGTPRLSAAFFPSGVWRQDMEMLKKLLSLLLAFSGPICKDSETLRTWCRRALSFVRELLAVTSTKLDDVVLGLVIAMVDDDQAWAAFYSLFEAQVKGDAPLGTGPSKAAVLLLDVLKSA